MEAAPAASALWAALGAAGTLVLGFLAWALLRRRRSHYDEEEETEEQPPVPVRPRAVPPSPPPPAPVPPPPAAPRAPEPFSVELRPSRLTLNEIEAVLEFELLIANGSGMRAEGIRLMSAIISANPTQDAFVGAFHAAPPGASPIAPFDLAPGQAWGVAGRLPLLRAQIHAVTVGGRAMFVPLVMVDLRWRGGLSLRRHGADFMVGIGGQGDKLGPIWLDRRLHQGLAATRYTPRPLVQAAAEMQRA